ncbi:hypothetical protein IL306_001801 [Fusarium sp. DS 682]|nr:hypothetical protein IL306_001801 [Fusarium sp. DS 682]
MSDTTNTSKAANTSDERCSAPPTAKEAESLLTGNTSPAKADNSSTDGQMMTVVTWELTGTDALGGKGHRRLTYANWNKEKREAIAKAKITELANKLDALDMPKKGLFLVVGPHRACRLD